VYLVCRIVRVGKMNPSDKDKVPASEREKTQPILFRRPFGAAVCEVRVHSYGIKKERERVCV
jgi:hypothetical protein